MFERHTHYFLSDLFFSPQTYSCILIQEMNYLLGTIRNKAHDEYLLFWSYMD